MKKAIGWFALVLVIHPFVVVWEAFALSKIWDWFLVPTHGSGPSLAGWFGLMAIASLVLNTALMAIPREKLEDEKRLGVLFWRQIGAAIAFAIVLGTTYLTGLALGWV